jgi:hypothetical protein
MQAVLEIRGDEPHSDQPESGRIRPNAFSWSMAMNLPMLKQTRVRSASSGLSDMWMDTNHGSKKIRLHAS